MRAVASFLFIVAVGSAGVVIWSSSQIVTRDAVALTSVELERIQWAHDRNNDDAESAPQQQVVNGWTANELLMLQARQNAESLNKANQLLVLLAGMMAVMSAGFSAALVALSRLLARSATGPTTSRHPDSAHLPALTPSP